MGAVMRGAAVGCFLEGLASMVQAISTWRASPSGESSASRQPVSASCGASTRAIRTGLGSPRRHHLHRRLPARDRASSPRRGKSSGLRCQLPHGGLQGGLFIQMSGGTAGPDGLALDAEGGLVACHPGTGVWRFDRMGRPTHLVEAKLGTGGIQRGEEKAQPRPRTRNRLI
jgi:hypothetical protein